MCLMNHEPHQRQVSEHGDETVGEMKPQELPESRRAVTTVPPRVVQMPHEVVQEGELDGGGRGEEIVARHPTIEERERGQLHNHSHGADQIELSPAEEGVHASGSAR